jgi:hypothetical protein
MSGPRRRPKALKIDRDVLRDARIKRHKHDRGGIGGLLITLAIAAAVGILVYVHRDQPPPPQPVQRQSASVLVEPVSDVVVQDDSVEDIVEPAEPIATFEEPTQPRHDHLSPELLEPSTRRIILQAGRLDGHPEHTAAPFTGEFGRDTAPGTIVRVEAERIREDFPQRILAGQSIVLHFGEMDPQNLLFRAKTVRRDEPGAVFDPIEDQPALRVLCNDNTIWDRNLSRQGFLINALIPASYLEGYRNTITLQNTGRLSVVFDALWIESSGGSMAPVRFAIRDAERIPADYASEFAWNREREKGQRLHRIPSNHDAFLQDPVQRFEDAIRRDEKIISALPGLWFYRNPATGIREQEKVGQLFLEKALGWYFQGGNAMTMQDIMGPGRFFCAQSGRLYPSAYVLWVFSRLFEGETQRLPVNVLPGYGAGQPLQHLYWMATENKPGVASIMITRSRFGSIPGGKVRVTCALPWRGTTAVTTHSGVFPAFLNVGKPTHRAVLRDGKREDDLDDPYDRIREDRTFSIHLGQNDEGGLLDIELDMQDSLYIRLVREGTTASMGAPPLVVEDAPGSTESAIRTIAGGDVTETRESGLLRRQSLPLFPDVMKPLTANYRIRIDKATRGSVQGVDYVVPELAQSIFCEIDYTKGRPRTAEGALLALHAFRERLSGKTVSFWVYPHAQANGRSIMLRMALGAWQGRVMLQPRKWQRVELQIADAEPDRQLLFMGPSDYDRSDREDTITFEFNGIQLLDPIGTASRYLDTRLLPDRRLAIVVLGEPGKNGIARHVFKKPVGVSTVSSAGAIPVDVDWTYSNVSQVLGVSGLRFPETPDNALLPYLTPREIEICRQSGLVPVVLIAEIDI